MFKLPWVRPCCQRVVSEVQTSARQTRAPLHYTVHCSSTQTREAWCVPGADTPAQAGPLLLVCLTMKHLALLLLLLLQLYQLLLQCCNPCCSTTHSRSSGVSGMSFATWLCSAGTDTARPCWKMVSFESRLEMHSSRTKQLPLAACLT
jgi:hypothetical protein